MRRATVHETGRGRLVITQAERDFWAWLEAMGAQGDLQKAYVKQHTRTLSTGKQVAVRAHSDKRTRKPAKASAPRQAAPKETGERILAIPVAQIRPDPEQHRKTFDAGQLKELAESMRESGQKTPIVVRPITDGGKVKYQIIAGERRWRAANIINLKHLKAVVREGVTEEEALTEQVIENLNRAQVTPMEEAVAYGQLAAMFTRRAKRQKAWAGKDFKDPAVQAKLAEAARQYVSKQTGKSQHHVAFYLKLNELEPEVQEMVSLGGLSPRHGNILTRLTDGPLDAKEMRERRLHQVRMARYARAHSTGADELGRMVTEYLGTRQQTTMFGEEEAGGGDKGQQRAEAKAKIDRIVDAVANAIAATFAEGKQEFRPAALTGGELAANVQKVRGAIKTLGQIAGLMEQEMARRDVEEATKRRTTATVEGSGSGGGGFGTSLFAQMKKALVRGHARKLASGKIVQVAAHQDKRPAANRNQRDLYVYRGMSSREWHDWQKRGAVPAKRHTDASGYWASEHSGFGGNDILVGFRVPQGVASRGDGGKQHWVTQEAIPFATAQPEIISGTLRSEEELAQEDEQRYGAVRKLVGALKPGATVTLWDGNQVRIAEIAGNKMRVWPVGEIHAPVHMVRAFDDAMKMWRVKREGYKFLQANPELIGDPTWMQVTQADVDEAFNKVVELGDAIDAAVDREKVRRRSRPTEWWTFKQLLYRMGNTVDVKKRGVSPGKQYGAAHTHNAFQVRADLQREPGRGGVDLRRVRLAKALLARLQVSKAVQVSAYRRKGKTHDIHVRSYTRGGNAANAGRDVRAPYNQTFIAGIKRLGGRWDAQNRTWDFPLDKEDEVRALLKRVFGTDDRAEEVEELVVQSPYNSAFIAEAKRIKGRWDPNARVWVFPVDQEAAVNDLIDRHWPRPIPTTKAPASAAVGDEEERPATDENLHVTRDRPYQRGQRIWRESEQRWYQVVSTRREYLGEESMSFGGDIDGYLYHADLRPLSAEEASEAEHAMMEKRRQAARQRVRAHLASLVRKNGTRPTGKQGHMLPWPKGEVLMDTRNIYGGGDAFVLGTTHVWYIRNNGADGDDWSQNNVSTGGAGAIGWRMKRTPTLARVLKRLAGVPLAKAVRDDARPRLSRRRFLRVRIDLVPEEATVVS